MTATAFARWRKRVGLNISAAGRMLGVNRETIRLWELGRNKVPRMAELACVAIEFLPWTRVQPEGKE